MYVYICAFSLENGCVCLSKIAFYIRERRPEFARDDYGAPVFFWSEESGIFNEE